MRGYSLQVLQQLFSSRTLQFVQLIAIWHSGGRSQTCDQEVAGLIAGQTLLRNNCWQVRRGRQES